MKPSTESTLSRRRAMKLSAGALLTSGLWPGRLRAAENGQGGEFTFIVVNDLHYLNDQCGPWFERVVRQMKATVPRPEFVLIAGDACEDGLPAQFGAIRELLNTLGLPYRTVIGNHDWTASNDRAAFDKTFPDSTNYSFVEHDWQFLGLDSSQGQKASGVAVQAHTLRYLDETLPKLRKDLPTVLVTHFPFGLLTPHRVVNADAVLERFKEFNLVAVYNGHFHGFTERRWSQTVLTTNQCCSFARGNHDRTPEKGYFVCTAKKGQLTRQFVEVKAG